MEHGKLSVIPGRLETTKTTLLIVTLLTSVLFLLGFGLWVQQEMTLGLALELSRLRHAMERLRLAGQGSTYTATVKLTPVAPAKDALSQTDLTPQTTEHI